MHTVPVVVVVPGSACFATRRRTLYLVSCSKLACGRCPRRGDFRHLNIYSSLYTSSGSSSSSSSSS